MPLHKLRVSAAELGVGRRVEASLGELDAPQALAVTLFEATPAGFTWRPTTMRALTRRRDARAGRRSALGIGPPSLEPVPDENWVALRNLPCRRSLPAGSSCTAAMTATGSAAVALPSRSRPARRSAPATMPRPRYAWRHSTVLVRRRHFARVATSAAARACSPSPPPRVLRAARVSAADNDPWRRRSPATTRGSTARRRVRVLDARGFDHPALRARRSTWCSPTSCPAP